MVFDAQNADLLRTGHAFVQWPRLYIRPTPSSDGSDSSGVLQSSQPMLAPPKTFTKEEARMKRNFVTPMLTVAAAVLLVGIVASAQDKSVKVPDGLGLSEFKGYEEWSAVAPSHTDHSTK